MFVPQVGIHSQLLFPSRQKERRGVISIGGKEGKRNVGKEYHFGKERNKGGGGKG
jgi:hypothetical protein